MAMAMKFLVIVLAFACCVDSTPTTIERQKRFAVSSAFGSRAQQRSVGYQMIDALMSVVEKIFGTARTTSEEVTDYIPEAGPFIDPIFAANQQSINAFFNRPTVTPLIDAVVDHVSTVSMPLDTNNRCQPTVYRHALQCPVQDARFRQAGDSCYYFSEESVSLVEAAVQCLSVNDNSEQTLGQWRLLAMNSMEEIDIVSATGDTLQELLSSDSHRVLYETPCSGGLPIGEPMLRKINATLTTGGTFGCNLLFADTKAAMPGRQLSCELERHFYACELALDGDASNFQNADAEEEIHEEESSWRVADRKTNRCAPRTYAGGVTPECPVGMAGVWQSGDSCYFATNSSAGYTLADGRLQCAQLSDASGSTLGHWQLFAVNSVEEGVATEQKLPAQFRTSERDSSVTYTRPCVGRPALWPSTASKAVDYAAPLMCNVAGSRNALATRSNDALRQALDERETCANIRLQVLCELALDGDESTYSARL